jgi:quinol monooxygenase YgiN
MSVVVAGTFRVPPSELDALRPHAVAVMRATRAEDGCAAYSYAEDIDEPGLIHVFEQWRDQAALDAHFQTPHMAAWREIRAAHQFTDRNLKVYEIAGERPI